MPNMPPLMYGAARKCSLPFLVLVIVLMGAGLTPGAFRMAVVAQSVLLAGYQPVLSGLPGMGAGRP